MAQRPVFTPCLTGDQLVREVDIEFEWVAGRELEQKQACIASWHATAQEKAGLTNILEISTRSQNPLGRSLSAFNLEVAVPGLETAKTVECVYQGSKVFEHVGPFTDLLEGTSWDAKADARLSSSGNVTGYRLGGDDWPSDPKAGFFGWLYLTALMQDPVRAEALSSYGGFTDIAFNPKTGINCQARAAAMYVALLKRDLLTDVMASPAAFLEVAAAEEAAKAPSATKDQMSFGF